MKRTDTMKRTNNFMYKLMICIYLSISIAHCARKKKITRNRYVDTFDGVTCSPRSAIKNGYYTCQCPLYRPYFLTPNLKTPPSCHSGKAMKQYIGCDGGFKQLSDTDGTDRLTINTCHSIVKLTNVEVLDWDGVHSIWNAKLNKTLLKTVTFTAYDNILKLNNKAPFKGLLARIWMKCTNKRVCFSLRVVGSNYYPLVAEKKKPVFYDNTPIKTQKEENETIVTAEIGDSAPNRSNNNDFFIGISVTVSVVIIVIILTLVKVVSKRKIKKSKNESENLCLYEKPPPVGVQDIITEVEQAYATLRSPNNDKSTISINQYTETQTSSKNSPYTYNKNGKTSFGNNLNGHIYITNEPITIKKDSLKCGKEVIYDIPELNNSNINNSESVTITDEQAYYSAPMSDENNPYTTPLLGTDLTEEHVYYSNPMSDVNKPYTTPLLGTDLTEERVYYSNPMSDDISLLDNHLTEEPVYYSKPMRQDVMSDTTTLPEEPNYYSVPMSQDVLKVVTDEYAKVCKKK